MLSAEGSAPTQHSAPSTQHSSGLLQAPARDEKRRRWLELGLLLALLAIAAGLRLANLLGRDPFVDEVLWVRWATHGFRPDDPTGLWVPMREGDAPPLFFWLELLTLRFGDNGFIGGRLAAALPATLSVLGVYGIVRVLFGIETALVAALLWATSPMAVFFGRIAVDDAALSLWTILATLASIVCIRRHSIVAGLACGLCLGLALLTKPLGLLTFPAPVLAWLVLDRPRLSRRLLLASLALLAGLGATLYPLLGWLPHVTSKVSIFADLSLADPSPLHVLRLDLLASNVPLALGWLSTYLGTPVLALALLGLLLGIAQRRYRREVVFLGLLWLIAFAALMDRAVLLYSRYLLSFTAPLFGLAAAASVWLGSTALRFLERRAVTAPAVLRVGSLGALGLAAAIAVLPLSLDIVATPARAALPPTDRAQYFDQWYAFFGLGRITDLIRHDAATGPVTILTPADAYPQQWPTDALQVALRGQSNVQFVADKALDEGWNLCPLRTWQASPSPVYLVLDLTQPDSSDPFGMPSSSQTVQAALARDLPSATAALSIPRPAGNGQLTAYRLDRPAADDTTGCLVANRAFGAGWHDMEKLLGGTEPSRWTDDTADYAEGPLPAGWYQVDLYARTSATLQRVQLSLNGTAVGDQGPVMLPSWQWIDASAPVWIEQGGQAHVQVAVQGAPSRLVVGRLLVRRVGSGNT